MIKEEQSRIYKMNKSLSSGWRKEMNSGNKRKQILNKMKSQFKSKIIYLKFKSKNS